MKTPDRPQTISARVPVTEALAGRTADGAGGSILPDFDAERALAGIALCPNNTAALKLLAAAGLKETDFQTPAGRVVLAAVDGHRRGKPIDLLTIRERLTPETIERLGGPVAFNRLVDDAPPVAHAEYHLAQFRDACTKRRLASLFANWQAAIDAGTKTGEIIADIRQMVEAETLTPSTPAAIDAGEWFDSEPPPPRFIMDGTIEGGDKGSIIAKSKERKSFLALQLALCVSAGRPFLCWDVPCRCRVLLVQFEIKATHFQRRFRMMTAALGFDKLNLGDRLAVVNARGWGHTGPGAVHEIGEMAKRHRAELIVIDPFYKVAEGDENAARDMKPTLAAFDRLAETGAAVLYVHHDAKGDAGARAIQDRGAGSGVTGRDDDFRFVLCPHDSEQGGAVLETMRRNFKPQDPVTIRWNDRGCFEYLQGVVAVKQSKPTTNRPPVASYREGALKLVSKKPLPVADFKARLQSMPGMSRDRARELAFILTDGDAAPLAIHEERRKGFHEKVIGTREQVERLERLERRES